MKKRTIIMLLSLTLILIAGSVSYSQTSPTSTPQTDRAVTISLCEKAKDEVIASRALIASYEDTLKAQEREQTLTDAELAKVREALDNEKAALAKKQAEVDALRKALAKEVKKKNFYKRVATSSVTTAIILGLILIL